MKNAYSVMLCCVAVLISIAPAPMAGQAPAPGEVEIPALFASHGLIEFTIETDYGDLRGDRSQESEYRPAILRMTDDAGAAREIDMRYDHYGEPGPGGNGHLYGYHGQFERRE